LKKIFHAVFVNFSSICILLFIAGDCTMVFDLLDGNLFHKFLFVAHIIMAISLIICLFGTFYDKYRKQFWIASGIIFIIWVILANAPVFQHARKIDSCFDMGNVWVKDKNYCECGCTDESDGIFDFKTFQCYKDGKICNE